jgi:hypothetical protein
MKIEIHNTSSERAPREYGFAVSITHKYRQYVFMDDITELLPISENDWIEKSIKYGAKIEKNSIPYYPTREAAQKAIDDFIEPLCLMLTLSE